MIKDSSIRNLILLEQLKAGEIKSIQPFYRKLDRLIREQLTRRELNELSNKEYKKFLSELDNEIKLILIEIADQVENKTTDIAIYEAEFEHKSLTINMDGKFKKLSETALLAAIATTPIQVSGSIAGKTVNEAVKTIVLESDRLLGIVKIGVAQGKTNSQIITAIRGTKANQYTDGVLNVTRKGIDSTVRTVISQGVAIAKDELYKANNDVIGGVEWVSTLDRRTTSACRYLDGKLFRNGEGPRPPIHYSCRSTVIPLTRLSFKKKRASESGEVDGGVTYYEWLNNQPTSVQDQALGRTRGQLFRDGGLTLEQFSSLQLDRNFRPITLARMKELEPLAFERAGLN